MAGYPGRRPLIAALAGVQVLLLVWILYRVAGGGGSPPDPAPAKASPPAPAAAAEFGSEDVDDPRPQLLPKSTVSIAGRTITVEVARSERQRTKGLMFRASMPDDTGMIFLFPETQEEVGFWNKNVPMDLDLIFADDAGRIVDTGRMKARDENSLRAKGDIRFVIEFPGGYLAKTGIKTGDRVELSPALAKILTSGK
jgi:uncharacterized membrane protein (UPF0127 family)